MTRARHLKSLFLLLVVLAALTSRAEALVLTKGPYLQRATTNSVIVMWQTEEASDARVDYGTTSAYGSSRYDGTSVSLHTVTLAGLSANTQYHYRVTSVGASGTVASDDATFWTAPLSGTPFRFAAYGDSRTFPAPHAAVVQSMLPGAPRFVLHVGDFCTDGRDDSQWGPQFFTPAAPLLRVAPLYPTLGGHEFEGARYFQYFAPPEGGGTSGREWYSFDYGDLHVISLDTNVDFSPGSAQYAWLVKDLQSTTAFWKVVFQHAPAYSSGLHGGDPLVQANLVPLYEQYGVDVVFAGHDHLYERSAKDGVTYFVTGGGGADLYAPNQRPNPYQQYAAAAYHHCLLELSGDTLTVRAIGTDGAAFDSVTLNDGVLGPVTDFTVSPTAGALPLTVQFTDASTGAPTSWAWDFGDGGSSAERDPAHQYLSAGRYTVSLTARNAAGADTETKPARVTVTFRDVPLTYGSLDSILTCVGAGVVRGYKDGTYRPTLAITRDQLAVFLARALAGGEAAVPTGPAVPSFSDVAAEFWAYRHIEYCKAQQIVTGYQDGSYRPGRVVNRGQMAVFVARTLAEPHGEGGLASYVPPLVPSFPDVPTSFWAYRHIEYLHAQGLIHGYADGWYYPALPTTRGQMAIYLAGLLAAWAE